MVSKQIRKHFLEAVRINGCLFEQATVEMNRIIDACSSMVSLSKLASKIFGGGTPQTTNPAYWNGDYFWLSSGETGDRFLIDTEKTITRLGIEESSTREAKKHDIVIASAGQGHTRGQTSLLFTDSYINQSIIAIHSSRELTPFLFFYIASRYEELRAISDSNSIRGSLTTKMIGSLPIPLLDKTQLEAYSSFCWPILDQIESRVRENKNLAVQRESLLPKLMSGEIDVDSIEIN